MEHLYEQKAVRIPWNILKEIKPYAKKHERSVTAQVRLILREWLDQQKEVRNDLHGK